MLINTVRGLMKINNACDNMKATGIDEIRADLNTIEKTLSDIADSIDKAHDEIKAALESIAKAQHSASKIKAEQALKNILYPR